LPSYTDKKPLYNKDESLADLKDELWAAFEAQPKIMRIMARDYAPYQLDLDEDYD
jgi:hypothetical protein